MPVNATSSTDFFQKTVDLLARENLQSFHSKLGCYALEDLNKNKNKSMPGSIRNNCPCCFCTRFYDSSWTITHVLQSRDLSDRVILFCQASGYACIRNHNEKGRKEKLHNRTCQVLIDMDYHPFLHAFTIKRRNQTPFKNNHKRIWKENKRKSFSY